MAPYYRAIDGVWSLGVTFGDAAAAIHYNCPDRALAVIVSRYFGIPAARFCDDFGDPPPPPLSQKALAVAPHAAAIIGAELNDKNRFM